MKIKLVWWWCLGCVVVVSYHWLAPIKSPSSTASFQSITLSNPLPNRVSTTRGEQPRIAPTSTATPRPQPTATLQPSPTVVPSPTAQLPLDGVAPEMAGSLISRSLRFDVYRGRDTFDQATIEQLLPRIESGIDRAETLLGSRLTTRSSLGFYRLSLRPNRGVRGLAATDERCLRLFYAPDDDVDSAVRVAIHELAHQLEYDRYGAEDQQLADTILHEGLATWLTDREWLARTSSMSWRERGRDLLQNNTLLPIRRDPSGASANIAYDGWASFVDYLISTYGWEHFDALYRSGRGRYAGSADYQLVYGTSLDDLVEQWHMWLQKEL